MESGELPRYDPLKDMHLRMYFASPRMRQHLQSVGLITDDGVPVSRQTYMQYAMQRERELQNRRMIMMDLLYRNREFQLGRLVELQKQLDSAEKVQIYRRIRGRDMSADSLLHMSPKQLSRSLSRNQLRQQLQSYAATRSQPTNYGSGGGDLTTGASSATGPRSSGYISDDGGGNGGQSLSSSFRRRHIGRYLRDLDRHRYMHRLDSESLEAFRTHLQRKLATLERFREMTFGTYERDRIDRALLTRRGSLPSLSPQFLSHSPHAQYLYESIVSSRRLSPLSRPGTDARPFNIDKRRRRHSINDDTLEVTTVRGRAGTSLPPIQQQRSSRSATVKKSQKSIDRLVLSGNSSSAVSSPKPRIDPPFSVMPIKLHARKSRTQSADRPQPMKAMPSSTIDPNKLTRKGYRRAMRKKEEQRGELTKPIDVHIDEQRDSGVLGTAAAIAPAVIAATMLEQEEGRNEHLDETEQQPNVVDEITEEHQQAHVDDDNRMAVEEETGDGEPVEGEHMEDAIEPDESEIDHNQLATIDDAHDEHVEPKNEPIEQSEHHEHEYVDDQFEATTSDEDEQVRIRRSIGSLEQNIPTIAIEAESDQEGRDEQKEEVDNGHGAEVENINTADDEGADNEQIDHGAEYKEEEVLDREAHKASDGDETPPTINIVTAEHVDEPDEDEVEHQPEEVVFDNDRDERVEQFHTEPLHVEHEDAAARVMYEDADRPQSDADHVHIIESEVDDDMTPNAIIVPETMEQLADATIEVDAVRHQAGEEQSIEGEANDTVANDVPEIEQVLEQNEEEQHGDHPMEHDESGRRLEEAAYGVGDFEPETELQDDHIVDSEPAPDTDQRTDEPETAFYDAGGAHEAEMQSEHNLPEINTTVPTPIEQLEEAAEVAHETHDRRESESSEDHEVHEHNIEQPEEAAELEHETHDRHEPESSEEHEVHEHNIEQLDADLEEEHPDEHVGHQFEANTVDSESEHMEQREEELVRANGEEQELFSNGDPRSDSKATTAVVQDIYPGIDQIESHGEAVGHGLLTDATRDSEDQNTIMDQEEHEREDNTQFDTTRAEDEHDQVADEEEEEHGEAMEPSATEEEEQHGVSHEHQTIEPLEEVDRDDERELRRSDEDGTPFIDSITNEQHIAHMEEPDNEHFVDEMAEEHNVEPIEHEHREEVVDRPKQVEEGEEDEEEEHVDQNEHREPLEMGFDEHDQTSVPVETAHEDELGVDAIKQLEQEPSAVNKTEEETSNDRDLHELTVHDNDNENEAISMGENPEQAKENIATEHFGHSNLVYSEDLGEFTDHLGHEMPADTESQHHETIEQLEESNHEGNDIQPNMDHSENVVPADREIEHGIIDQPIETTIANETEPNDEPDQLHHEHEVNAEFGDNEDTVENLDDVGYNPVVEIPEEHAIENDNIDHIRRSPIENHEEANNHDGALGEREEPLSDGIESLRQDDAQSEVRIIEPVHGAEIVGNGDDELRLHPEQVINSDDSEIVRASVEPTADDANIDHLGLEHEAEDQITEHDIHDNAKDTEYEPSQTIEKLDEAGAIEQESSGVGHEHQSTENEHVITEPEEFGHSAGHIEETEASVMPPHEYNETIKSIEKPDEDVPIESLEHPSSPGNIGHQIEEEPTHITDRFEHDTSVGEVPIDHMGIVNNTEHTIHGQNDSHDVATDRDQSNVHRISLSTNGDDELKSETAHLDHDGATHSDDDEESTTDDDSQDASGNHRVRRKKKRVKQVDISSI